jgi:hypothetical protein
MTEEPMPPAESDEELEPLPDAPIEELAVRITELEQAFRSYEQSVPGLTVDVVGRVSGNDELVHPIAGFTVRLEHGRPEKAGVSLYVSARYGELTRWRGPGQHAGGALRERFSVRLVDEFGWGESVFPTAAALAHDLVGYLQYNLDSLG